MTRTQRHALTLVELLVVIAIIAVLISLLVPAVIRVRESANRIKCANNLHQIGLAMHNYEGVNGHFPPSQNNWRLDTFWPPKPQYGWWSWRALLMPYLEEQNKWSAAEALFKIGSQPPPIDPPPPGIPNPEAFQYGWVGDSSGRYFGPFAVVNPLFSCPSDGRTLETVQSEGLNMALSSYLGVNGIDLWAWSTTPTGPGDLRGVMGPTNKYRGDLGFMEIPLTNHGTRIQDISDGLINTLLVGERPPAHSLDFGWAYALTSGQEGCGTLDAALGVNEVNLHTTGVTEIDECGDGPYSFGPGSINNPCDVFHYYSPHGGGANFLIADGSVHFLTYGIKDQVMRALASMSGDEVVPPWD